MIGMRLQRYTELFHFKKCKGNVGCGSIGINDMIIINSAVWHHNFGNYPGDADHSVIIRKKVKGNE